MMCIDRIFKCTCARELFSAMPKHTQTKHNSPNTHKTLSPTHVYVKSKHTFCVYYARSPHSNKKKQKRVRRMCVIESENERNIETGWKTPGLTENGKEWEITSLVPIASTCSNCTIYVRSLVRSQNSWYESKIIRRKVVQRTNNDRSNKIVEDKNKKGKRTKKKRKINFTLGRCNEIFLAVHNSVSIWTCPENVEFSDTLVLTATSNSQNQMLKAFVLVGICNNWHLKQRLHQFG